MNPLLDVVVESLSVRYSNELLALDGVDLHIGKGLFGLLGPNGAGKTTLMRTLATLQEPTEGRARVYGHDVVSQPNEVRRRLGYLPQDFQTYPQLKTWEVLDYYALLNEMVDRAERHRRIDSLLEWMGLREVRNRRAGQLSGGMLRRLGIAQALLNDPGLLILDEPTVGLDPAERIDFRNFLAELSRERVVILSTHIVSDIGSSCSDLAVLDRGQVRFHGHRQDLVQQAAGKVWRVLVNDAEYQSIREHVPITSMTETAEGVELRVVADVPKDARWQAVAPNLEEGYLWLLRDSKSALGSESLARN